MTDARMPRTLMIPDHLWLAFDQMAREMGNDRDGLVSQALFSFARQHGYVVPGATQAGIPPYRASEPGQPVGSAPAINPSAPPTPALRRPIPQASARTGSAPPATMMMEADAAARAVSAPRPSANAQRVAELERQLAASPPPRRKASNPPPVQDDSVQVDDSLLGEDEQNATHMELPSLDSMGLAHIRKERAAAAAAAAAGQQPHIEPPEPPETTPMPGDPAKVLVLLADGREIDRVVKERFLIGRGKHCDLIINSGKVSREHAAITREGGDYFIEDLGSSNGTWFDKRRISRRQIEEGDEFFICAERLSCSFQ